MTYSCSDFADTIIDALGVVCDDDMRDSPSDQADACLAEIARLKNAVRQQRQPLLHSLVYDFYGYGPVTYLFTSEELANQALAKIVRARWDKKCPDEPCPEEDAEMLDLYAEGGHGETWEIDGPLTIDKMPEN